MDEQGASRVVYLGLPAFNEQAAIRPLFQRIRAARTKLTDAGLIKDLQVIFYDDGSTDDTAAEVRINAVDVPVTLLSPERNGGLGKALQGIMSYFLQRAASSDVLVIMDSDDTHDPAQIEALLGRMDAHGEQVVVASRYQRGSRISGVPANRQVLSLGFAALVKTILPIKGVRDYSCGYRAYTYASLRAVAKGEDFHLDESGFASMPEILVRLRNQSLRFGEIPLQLHYDQRLTISKMRAWQNTTRLMQCLMRWRISPPQAGHSVNGYTPILQEIGIEHVSSDESSSGAN